MVAKETRKDVAAKIIAINAAATTNARRIGGVAVFVPMVTHLTYTFLARIKPNFILHRK